MDDTLLMLLYSVAVAVFCFCFWLFDVIVAFSGDVIAIVVQ